MYSRAERLFLMPDADHANPVLGPGTYNPDNVGQIWGKSTKKAGYVSSIIRQTDMLHFLLYLLEYQLLMLS